MEREPSLLITGLQVAGRNKTFSSVWGDVIWKSGKHSFDVRLDKLNTYNIAIGVALRGKM